MTNEEKDAKFWRRIKIVFFIWIAMWIFGNVASAIDREQHAKQVNEIRRLLEQHMKDCK